MVTELILFNTIELLDLYDFAIGVTCSQLTTSGLSLEQGNRPTLPLFIGGPRSEGLPQDVEADSSTWCTVWYPSFSYRARASWFA